MSIVRSIEVIAQSPNGFDAACQEAIKEAAKTLRGIRCQPDFPRAGAPEDREGC